MRALVLLVVLAGACGSSEPELADAAPAVNCAIDAAPAFCTCIQVDPVCTTSSETRFRCCVDAGARP